MGQYDRGLRILVIDPDQALQAELRSFNAVGSQISFLAHTAANTARDQVTQADIVVVAVDCPTGLSLVADLSARPGMPPVIALGGVGFDGKPPEHILLLAELRGAALALPKPISASELMVAAIGIEHKRRPAQDNTPVDPYVSRWPIIPPDAA